MNLYLFWISFIGLLTIIPLMIIKGRKGVDKKIKPVQEGKAKKKGWFK